MSSKKIGFVETDAVRQAGNLEHQGRQLISVIDGFNLNVSSNLEPIEKILDLASEHPVLAEALREFAPLSKVFYEAADGMRGMSTLADRLERIAERLSPSSG